MTDVENYDNAFADDNVYGHAVALIADTKPLRGGIHLDFGCGYGRMAEVLRDRLGLRYIGVDINEDGLNSLKARGFETMFVDLRDPRGAAGVVRTYLPRDAKVVSMSILDTLEHLSEPKKAIEVVRLLAAEHICPLVASVPNFAHRDIGLRLAMGLFDYTQAGLLDHTHLNYYTAQSFERLMRSCGWHEIARNDVRLVRSDQSFPRDHAAIATMTPLHKLLAGLREQVDDTGTINQMVRLFVAGHQVPEDDVIDSIEESRGNDAFFLTVLTRTQGRRIDTLRETLLCLSAQTDQDFEVLVVGHDLDLERQLAVEGVIAELHGGIRDRVRLLRVEGGTRAKPLNAGFEAARGRYVAMLDDDDLVAGNWVETFSRLAGTSGGSLLRGVAVAQSWDKVTLRDGGVASRAAGPFQALYPEDFDLFMHLTENRSPLHSLAFPRSLFTDLHFRFDDHLTTAEDWDFIVRVAPVAGVACAKDITCIYRRWINTETSFSIHSQDEWRANYYYSLRKMDAAPLLLPVGGTRMIRDLMYELDRLRAGPSTLHMPYTDPDLSSEEVEQARYLEALRWRYHELTHSMSWQMTAPLRWVMKLVTGRPPLDNPHMLWRLSARDLEYLIRQVENSRSWRMTRFLRGRRGQG